MTHFQVLQTNSQSRKKIYTPSEITELLSTHFGSDIPVIKTNKKMEYLNFPASFDIETTSFYENGEKRACMYEWTFGLNGAVVVGRNWEEFVALVQTVAEWFELSDSRHLMIYIHNEAFEFQFMRKWFAWDKVFAVNERKPVYAVTTSGIEFRCSYILTNSSLASIGENLRKYPVKKMVGDLDYSLPRHSGTVLTDKELGYMINDVLVVMAFIQERIELDGDISRIPLTKTGYVRRYCKNACMYNGGSHRTRENTYKYLNYRKLMNQLTLEESEYVMLRKAFQGGFTHANGFYVKDVKSNVKSYDFTSSYPAVMVADKFPMSKGEFVECRTNAEFERNIALYCCVFEITFEDIESTELYEHPISVSHCDNIVNYSEDNGRVVEAGRLSTTITEQDFYIYRKFYRWRSMKVGRMVRYMRGYLPTDFVKSILTLYGKKTTLKGVEGKEDDYLRSKEDINSAYGMTVTEICRELNEYTNEEWSKTLPVLSEELAKVNRSKSRFLFYAWGIYVTAYARRNLFTGIYEFKNDYVYSDTDSIKVLNSERHTAYIEDYNRRVVAKLETALKFHHIPLTAIRPKTIKGEEKVLGVWDDEGIYSRFKTLGAKRYMTEKKGVLSLTVSGVNKHNAIPYLLAKYGSNTAVFEAFDDEMYLPSKNDLGRPIFDDNGVEILNPTGKMTHTYIDEEISGVLVDYNGVPGVYHELSFIHLENADYSLSLSDNFINYLNGIKEIEK